MSKMPLAKNHKILAPPVEANPNSSTIQMDRRTSQIQPQSNDSPPYVAPETDINDSGLDDKMTTIQVSIKSKKKWDSLKNHSHETYEDMINRFIRIIEEEANLTDQDIKEIERSLEKIKQGKFVSL